MKNKKFILALISVLSVCVLLAAYFTITKPKDLENRERSQKEVTNTISITLETPGKIYKGSINNGASVYDAMQMFKETSLPNNSFSFIAKEYKGMGFFIEEINGVKGETDKYWILYVNGQKPSVGVSDYKLKEGDVVTWKQEKSF